MGIPREDMQNALHEKFEVEWETLRRPETSFQDIEFDSLDIADLIVEIERRTGKEIEFSDLVKVGTLGELYEYAEKLE